MKRPKNVGDVEFTDSADRALASGGHSRLTEGAGMTAHVVDAPRRKVTLEELRAHREEIEEMGRRYGVSNIRVFGSVARGDAHDNSDLDLLIDASAETGLFDLIGFVLDVVDESGLVLKCVPTRRE